MSELFNFVKKYHFCLKSPIIEIEEGQSYETKQGKYLSS